MCCIKRIITIVCILLTIVFPFSALAHSGGTDGKGGHYNHSTGEYHYHHGHPAHQHKDGECPYDIDYSKGTSNDAPWYVVVLVSIICVAVYILDYKVLDGKILGFFITLFCGILFAPFYIFGLMWTLIEWIVKKIKNK